MLTAGDEFGRTQHGNNNAYAQDNEITWLDWQGRDAELEAHVAALCRVPRALARRSQPTPAFSTASRSPADCTDVEWLTESGQPLDEANGSSPSRHRLSMLLASPTATAHRRSSSMATAAPIVFALPARPGFALVAAAAGHRARHRRRLDVAGC